MKKYTIEFTDKRNPKFKKEFTIQTQNDALAYQWSDKQRDQIRKSYDPDKNEYKNTSDPKKWAVKVSEVVSNKK